MLPLYDLIAQAQNGQGLNLLARQFDLNQQQAQLAVDSLLPAFSEAFRRNSASPAGLGGLMAALSTGQHAKYFEDAAKAFAPGGVDEGNGILGHLFGSKDLSRAVAAQAQAATGISQSVLQQMLPVIASMLMGGLFKQSTGQMQAAAGTGADNPFGRIIEEMMRQQMGTQQRAPAPSPMDNPLGKILEGMLGGGMKQAPSGGTGSNPWGDLLDQMMKGGFGQQPAPQQQARPAPQPRQAPQTQGSDNPFGDMLDQMFKTGRQVQETHQTAVKDIFDQYLKNMDRLR